MKFISIIKIINGPSQARPRPRPRPPLLINPKSKPRPLSPYKLNPPQANKKKRKPKMFEARLLLLLLALALPSSSLRFREAPQFFNSPSCPLPPPPSSPPCSPSFLLHVAMTLDSAYLRGSLAAIHSVLQHSSCPESLHFHFLFSQSHSHSFPSLRSTLSSSFPSLPFLLHPFPSSLVSLLISPSLRPALDRPLNYARSYLPRLLPSCISRIVYLDSDLILLDDIASLASTPIPPPSALAAPEYCNANFTSYFTPAFWSHPSLPLTFRARRPCYFNTGVMVMDLDRWRRDGYTDKIEEWMRVQKRTRIYELGSLPPFLLVFAGRIAAVDHRWNQHGLGGDNFRGLCRDLHPGPASLLHWSGKGKPWARIDARRPCPIDALWAPYDLLDHDFSVQDEA